MDYKNVDFNSDVVAMYSKLRECMALAFDTECFGPIDIPVQIKLRSSLSTRTLLHSQPGVARNLWPAKFMTMTDLHMRTRCAWLTSAQNFRKSTTTARVFLVLVEIFARFWSHVVLILNYQLIDGIIMCI